MIREKIDPEILVQLPPKVVQLLKSAERGNGPKVIRYAIEWMYPALLQGRTSKYEQDIDLGFDYPDKPDFPEMGQTVVLHGIEFFVERVEVEDEVAEEGHTVTWCSATISLPEDNQGGTE
jgi:hypothetical protein